MPLISRKTRRALVAIGGCLFRKGSRQMVIRGRVRSGVVVLEDNVHLPDGTEVSVIITPSADTNVRRMTEQERQRYQAILDQIDALPDENPNDSFSGTDHDRILYGERP